MADEPITESTPTPATEPASTPAAEPATPAAEPQQGYPTKFEDPKPEYVHETVYNGQRIPMTKEDVDQVTAIALKSEQERQERERKGQPQTQPQTQPTQQPPSELAAVTQELQSLRQEVQTTRQDQKTEAHRTRIKDLTASITTNVDAEIAKHDVFKENPELVEIAKEQSLAILSANTSMSEKAAVEKIAAKQGAALNASQERWVKAKMKDASDSEASPGGAGVATPGPKASTGKDLAKGRIAGRVMARLRNKEVANS